MNLSGLFRPMLSDVKCQIMVNNSDTPSSTSMTSNGHIKQELTRAVKKVAFLLQYPLMRKNIDDFLDDAETVKSFRF